MALRGEGARSIAGSREQGPRTVSAPVERRRIEALVDAGRSSPDSYLLVARVLPLRRQQKLTTFAERKDGRIAVDWEGLRRTYPGEALRFQLREHGQVLGTAQWHVPKAFLHAPTPSPGPRTEAAAPLPSPGIPSDGVLASSTPEAQRLREDLAASRAECSLLAEEARRLRTDLERERVARARAEAERDVARTAEESARAEAGVLRERLHEAEMDQVVSEIAFHLLGERVPADLQEVHRIVSRRR